MDFLFLSLLDHQGLCVILSHHREDDLYLDK